MLTISLLPPSRMLEVVPLSGEKTARWHESSLADDSLMSLQLLLHLDRLLLGQLERHSVGHQRRVFPWIRSNRDPDSRRYLELVLGEWQ